MMAAPEGLLKSNNKNPTATVLSLIVPGSGQFLLGHRWRGVVILIITAILAFLVNWALVTAEDWPDYDLGGLVTSWLWLPFLLFWVWNVLDATAACPLSCEPALAVTAQGPSMLFAVLFAAIILYVIAWNVTEVKLDRLITRFSDAQAGAARPGQPGNRGHDRATAKTVICNWDCLCGFIGDQLAGREPAQQVKVSEQRSGYFWTGQRTERRRAGW